jgi:excisionase family DNA binding protein
LLSIGAEKPISVSDFREILALLREFPIELLAALRELPEDESAAERLADSAIALHILWRLWKEYGLRPWLTAKEAAEWLGVSEGRVSAWIRGRTLPAKRPDPDGRWYVPVLLLVAWLLTPDNRQRVAEVRLKQASGGKRR